MIRRMRCLSPVAGPNICARDARVRSVWLRPGRPAGRYANLWGSSLRGRCGCLVVVRWTEAEIAMTEGVFERIVQHGCPHFDERLHRRPVPSHLLLLVHPLGHDFVDRTLDERGRDRFAASTPGGVVHQRAFAPLEVGQQLTDVPLETPDTGHVKQATGLVSMDPLPVIVSTTAPRAEMSELHNRVPMILDQRNEPHPTVMVGRALPHDRGHLQRRCIPLPGRAHVLASGGNDRRHSSRLNKYAGPSEVTVDGGCDSGRSHSPCTKCGRHTSCARPIIQIAE